MSWEGNIEVADHRYSDGVYNENILLLGPVAPPLGGVSVHIARVAKKLQNQENIVFQHDTERSYNPFLRYVQLLFFLFRSCPDSVHYHTLYHHGIEFFLVVLCKFILNFELVTIDHNCRYAYKKTWSYAKFFACCLRYVISQSVVIGDKTYQSYSDVFGIKNMQKSDLSISVESPFLPPNPMKEDEIYATYPDSLYTFLSKHSPNMLVNAFRLVLYNDCDLYGFDQAIAMLAHVKKEYPNIGLIFALADRGDGQLYEKCMTRIEENDLSNFVYMLEGQRELWPLFKRVDVFVRPTLSDGYSVSVVEGCYFEIPVVASDVCARPGECVLYKAGDSADLCRAVFSVLR